MHVHRRVVLRPEDVLALRCGPSSRRNIASLAWCGHSQKVMASPTSCTLQCYTSWHGSYPPVHMQEQIVNAVTALDKSLRLNNSKDVDSLLLMGKLLPQTTSGMPAQPKLELLKEGAQHHSSNPEVQVHLVLHKLHDFALVVAVDAAVTLSRAAKTPVGQPGHGHGQRPLL